jgi:hypothetical protein
MRHRGAQKHGNHQQMPLRKIKYLGGFVDDDDA